MWNSYWSGRSRRDLPQVDYRDYESSDEDNYTSPLVSPNRPPPTRSGSPVELAIPTLGDNVDEELESVRQTLTNVGHTHTYRGTRPRNRPEPEGDDQPLEEVVEEGLVTGPGSIEVSAPQAAIMVNYDQQNENDDANAISNARDVRLPFNKEDVKLWFNLIESKMQFAGIKKQWSKRQVLIQLIPTELHTDFRQYLQQKEDEA